MIWQKIGNSVSDGLFRDSVRDSVIAENQCLYTSNNQRKLLTYCPRHAAEVCAQDSVLEPY